MPNAIILKQGDTIRWQASWSASGALVDLTGYEIRATIRNSDGAAFAELTATILDQVTSLGQCTFVLSDSSAIPLGQYEVDFRFREPGTDSYTSESIALVVVQGATRRW